MSKSICMILDTYYPSDIRVFKESESLIAAGFEVHLVCLRRNDEAAEEEINGLRIHRLNGPKSVVQKGIADVLDVVRGYFSPLFYNGMKALFSKSRFDFIHVHDLPLANTAIKFKSVFPEVKVYLDLHENYPEAFRVWFTWRKNPIIRWKNRTFFNYERWSKYEQSACARADGVIAVVDEMKDKLLVANPDIPITVITNTEKTDFLNQPLDESIYGEDAKKFIITYTGNVGPHRGVDTAIRGMEKLRDLDIVLYIVGGARPYMTEKMIQMVDDLGLQNSVRILGYQPFEKFFSYMKMASVNLIPHNKNGHTDNTVPHKLFQSMMVGNPVLVSSVDPLKRIVGSCESGLVFKAEDEEDFATQVRRLYEDRDMCNKLGHNGYLATVQGEYNWEVTGSQLVEIYKDGK